MATQPRARRGPPQSEELDLLDQLLQAPPVSRVQRLAPVSLRSMQVQRDHALRGFLRRTWVDYVLKHAERLLVFAALFVFCVWFTDGPLRDWLHTQEQATAAVRLVPTVAPASSIGNAIPGRVAPLLPFVNAATAAAPDEAFLTPREVVPADTLVQSHEPSRLVIPKLELDTPVKHVFVVAGVWEVADYAAGYLDGTALPGDTGNTVLAGHAGIRGSVFRALGQLAPGDPIYLDAGGWRFHYRVRSATNVWPNQLEVLASRGQAELTLMTCTNWDTQRLVVVADLLDSVPAPGIAPAR